MQGDSMSYGVVASKVDEVIEEIKLELVTNAVEALKNNEAIKTSLKAAWSGVDCDNFITNFDKAVQSVCAELESYESQIRATLKSIPEQWSQFQSTNVTSG